MTADGRGAHGKQKTTTPDIEKRIDDHLKSFPTEGSHYTLGSTQEFLDSELTGHRMWRLYLKLHEPCVYRSMFEAVMDLAVFPVLSRKLDNRGVGSRTQ